MMISETFAELPQSQTSSDCCENVHRVLASCENKTLKNCSKEKQNVLISRKRGVYRKLISVMYELNFCAALPSVLIHVYRYLFSCSMSGGKTQKLDRIQKQFSPNKRPVSTTNSMHMLLLLLNKSDFKIFLCKLYKYPKNPRFSERGQVLVKG